MRTPRMRRRKRQRARSTRVAATSLVRHLDGHVPERTEPFSPRDRLFRLEQRVRVAFERPGMGPRVSERIVFALRQQSRVDPQFPRRDHGGSAEGGKRMRTGSVVC